MENMARDDLIKVGKHQRKNKKMMTQVCFLYPIKGYTVFHNSDKNWGPSVQSATLRGDNSDANYKIMRH